MARATAVDLEWDQVTEQVAEEMMEELSIDYVTDKTTGKRVAIPSFERYSSGTRRPAHGNSLRRQARRNIHRSRRGGASGWQTPGGRVVRRLPAYRPWPRRRFFANGDRFGQVIPNGVPGDPEHFRHQPL